MRQRGKSITRITFEATLDFQDDVPIDREKLIEAVGDAIEDLAHADDGSATILVRRTKTDAEGEGSYAFLAPDTADHVSAWLEVAELTDGALFRSVAKGGCVGPALSSNGISRIFKGIGYAAGLSSEVVRDISGHSSRVGCAQDMAAFGIELSAIMQAGRWKTATMVSRYTEKLVARRGGAAKLAALQNRL